jgi:hypothetical protein
MESTCLGKDPYALAYRYWEYMTEYQKRQSERKNPYDEKLLANQPDPEPDATDDRSRAVLYAEDHYESFYEVRDTKLIIQWLNEANAR